MAVAIQKHRNTAAQPDTFGGNEYNMLRFALLLLPVAIFMMVGCSKKVTVVQKPVVTAQPAQVAAPEPEPVKLPQPENIDSLARSILATIYFDFNIAEIGISEKYKLEAIGPFLMQHPGIRILAEGHCDERGSSEYNIGLGERRARAVKLWLTGYGIAAERIDVTSFGKERPAKSGCATRECHAANRRAAWKILAQ